MTYAGQHNNEKTGGNIETFVEDGTTIFYGHFVDGTMVANMPKDVAHVHQYLNNID